MARTRGKGEGSIFQRKDGYWVAQLEAARCHGGHRRRDGTICKGGERRRPTIVRRTKAEVLGALPGFRDKVSAGTVGVRMRVDPYLDFWLTEVVNNTVAASTLAEYTKQLARCRPALGREWLDKLRKHHIQKLANQLTERYAPKTRNGTLSTLKQALQWAVPDYIPTNPAEYVQAPRKIVVKVDDTLEAAEAEAVLTAASGDRYEALYWLALNYGLRIGELLGLDWAAIDVDDWDAAATGSDELSVVEAKTVAGVRSLPLIPEAKTQLAAHRRRTIAAGRLPAGPVFVGPEGGKLKAQRVREWYSDLLARAGITHKCRNCPTEARCSSNVRRFHSSRHTAATLLLEDGVPLEVVTAILGHANISITASIYAKVRADLKRKGLNRSG